MDNIEKVEYILKKNGFNNTKETTKSIRFESKRNSQIIYLIKNKIISIALNPYSISDKLKQMSKGKFHSTDLRDFPKRLNNGQSEITYGYSFKFETEGELDTFLNKYINI